MAVYVHIFNHTSSSNGDVVLHQIINLFSMKGV
jgi:hypothetical protein